MLVLLLTCEGSIARPPGLLATCFGRWEVAERHFEQALPVDERLGVRPCVVRTRRSYASMLLDCGAASDAARAAELIAAETLGMAREMIRLQRLRERMERGRSGA